MTKNFPTLVVDGFLDNPDAVVDFAHTLRYEPDEEGRWPGVRSQHISEVNAGFFDAFCKSFFGLYFNYEVDQVDWVVDLRFQKVPNTYTDGWIHADTCLLTGLVYLNKNETVGAGTSLYRLKRDRMVANLDEHCADKLALYTGAKTVAEVESSLQESNAKFEETLSVGALYNRLIAFESDTFHGAQNFHTSDYERLTLIAFVHKLGHGLTPMHRARGGGI